MFENDDEEVGLYENGHWIWSEATNAIVFQRDLTVSEEVNAPLTPIAVFGNVEFKDDIDIIEQQKFRKRFQRKVEENDVIFLQDIMDVVLYTAPQQILTPTVVNIIHAPSTERFLRALILYCQYYVQTTEEMSRRIIELETKIRTTNSMEIEREYKNDLEDLRLLVAKQYVIMILGAGDYKKYHHMGPKKKVRSLSKKDIGIFESFLRISIQIVWLTLGRKSFNQIEIEINRLFKSQIFNMVEHKLKTNYVAKLTQHERDVLLGDCLRQKQKLNTNSPLLNELFCQRSINFKLLGLATIKFSKLSPRLRYLEQSLSMSERFLREKGVILGILGLPRSHFDIMLKEIKMGDAALTSSASIRTRSVSKTSRSSVMRKSTVVKKLYEDIQLPPKEDEVEQLPEQFPEQLIESRSCNPQRLKWLTRSRLGSSHKGQSHNLRPNIK